MKKIPVIISCFMAPAFLLSMPANALECTYDQHIVQKDEDKIELIAQELDSKLLELLKLKREAKESQDTSDILYN